MLWPVIRIKADRTVPGDSGGCFFNFLTFAMDIFGILRYSGYINHSGGIDYEHGKAHEDFCKGQP